MKGHGFSRAVSAVIMVALEHFHTWCTGWSTASAVQLGFGNETALAAEVTETLPQALKRDPRIDGSYARLKACSTHRLYTRCETAIKRAIKKELPSRINAGAPTKEVHALPLLP